MASPRRIGAPDAKNRAVLLDAAEQLMLQEGYAAVTSRRVAAKAGLKPQLVHYCFRTMDDLFLAMLAREALSRAGERYGLPPAVLTILMTGISRVIVHERALGVSAGHEQMLA